MSIVTQGTLLQFKNNADTWVNVADVNSIGGPDMSAEVIEDNHLNSERIGRKLAGMIDLGDIPFNVSYDPDNTTHNHVQGVLAQFFDGKSREWRVLWPTDEVVENRAGVSWTGFLTGFSFGGMEPNGKLTADITATPDGIEFGFFGTTVTP